MGDPAADDLVSSLMIDIAFQPAPVDDLDIVQHWDFGALRKREWEWTFLRPADKAPHQEGALVMLDSPGPVLRLDTEFDASAVDVIELDLAAYRTTATGDTPVTLPPGTLEWVRDNDVEEGLPQFHNMRVMRFALTNGKWIAPAATHHGKLWSDEIHNVRIALDLPEYELGSGEHYSVFFRKIRFLAAAPGAPPYSEVPVLVKRVEILGRE
jgi:hypothetical protein